MKTIAHTGKSLDLKVRARWHHRRTGARMILVGKRLYVAGPGGDYRYAFAGADEAVKTYAARRGYSRIPTGNAAHSNDHGFLTGKPIRKSERDALDFGDYLDRQKYELPKDRVLDFGAAGVLVEFARLCPPASSVRETEGEAAYLALIEGHARRVAAAGWGGSQEGRPPIDAPPPPPPRKRGGCRLRPETRLAMLPDWLHVSYCACCRLLLRCVEQPERPAKLNPVLRRKVNRVPVETRLADRPYCPKCVPSRTMSA